jgi:hypothetical protein
MSQNGTYLCDNTGDSASDYGLGSGDLCIPYQRAHDNTWGYVFGDSWTGREQSGIYLGSPVMLNQQTFDATGNTAIRFSGAEPSPPAAQLFDYQHWADNGFGVVEVTRIPNDAIEFNGRTFIQYTSVETWVGPNSAVDGSAFAGVAYSDDYGATWQDFAYHWRGQALGIDGNPYEMWTFAGIDPDGFLYCFSKRWNGSHNYAGDKGYIQLFRYHPNDFHDGNLGVRQNWAYVDGAWGWYAPSRHAPSPIFGANGNDLGEFSVKRIGSTYVMSYFDVTDYSIKTRTASRPDAVWSAEQIQVVGSNFWPPAHWGKPRQPALYGGYIHPGSQSTANLTLIISQWDGIVGGRPYTAAQWTGDVCAQ